MHLRDIMRQPVQTVDAGATLADAYALMHHSTIRHLPVMDGERLVGIVTDRDLRYATSALHPQPFPPDAAVRDVMTAGPVTATPRDPVEEAARVMRNRKIGALPVVEGDRLVGIVTGTDLLDALVRLMGVAKPSGRLAIRLEDTPGQLARLTGYLAEHQLNIHALLTYPDGDTHIGVVLRVGTLNTRELADDLRGHGFDVLWPTDKSWSP